MTGNDKDGSTHHHNNPARPTTNAVVIHRTGNTSSASIPLALADALEAGRVDHGDLILLVGFGGGMTAASCVLRWGADAT